jgi:hypothetical protein
MLVTSVKQQRAIGRAAQAAGGYFKLAQRLTKAQAATERTKDAPSQEQKSAAPKR